MRYTASKPKQRLLPKDGRIGVPRTLAYDELRVFFDSLIAAAGFRCAVSPRSSKAVLAAGASRCVEDVCLPLKVYFGHVHALLEDNVEVVLVPRLVSVAKGRNFCPKLHVLPDLVRAAFPGLGLLAPYVDLHHSKRSSLEAHLVDACTPMLWQLGVSASQAAQMVREAFNAQQQDTPPAPPRPLAKGPVIAVLGHSYAELDPFCGLDVPRQLTRLGAQVVLSPIPVPDSDPPLAADIYYEPTHRTARAAAARIGEGVDGVVLLTFFACGPDSYGAELLLHRLARHAVGVPVLRLIADEQCAAEGLATRLETFVDIVRDAAWRRRQC